MLFNGTGPQRKTLSSSTESSGIGQIPTRFQRNLLPSSLTLPRVRGCRLSIFARFEGSQLVTYPMAVGRPLVFPD